MGKNLFYKLITLNLFLLLMPSIAYSMGGYFTSEPNLHNFTKNYGDNTKKEILIFFSYRCEHCQEFSKYFNKIESNKGKYTKIRFIPIINKDLPYTYNEAKIFLIFKELHIKQDIVWAYFKKNPPLNIFNNSIWDTIHDITNYPKPLIQKIKRHGGYNKNDYEEIIKLNNEFSPSGTPYFVIIEDTGYTQILNFKYIYDYEELYKIIIKASKEYYD